MHFLGEALYRRPFETKTLAYTRGAIAILLTLLFLAFCGYLINQICDYIPLIQYSFEDIGLNVSTPDIEVCAQNSTFHFVKCTAMYYNWTMMDIPNCFGRFFRHGDDNELSKCRVFQSNDTYRMAAGLTLDNRDALRRLDFYWVIDSAENMSYSTITVPAMAIYLYDPRFSPWRPGSIGNTKYENETFTNIQLGYSRATTYLNQSTSIFYSMEKYRAIQRHDARAILGLTPNYVDVVTLSSFQHDWPLQINPPSPSPALDLSLFQGIFSVQLSKNIMDVRAEVRQHSILGALALAGGCYGILTSVYIALFGMPRLAPWGLVHHAPTLAFQKKHNDNDNSKEYKEEEDASYHNESGSQLDVAQYSQKEDSIILVNKDNAENKQNIPQLSISTQISKKDSKKTLHLPDLCLFDSRDVTESPETMNFSSSSTACVKNHTFVNDEDFDVLIKTLSQEQNRVKCLQTKTNVLTDRIEELEVILSQYFINTNYLDRMRFTAFSNAHDKSNSIERKHTGQ